ncbi:hypothetical protein QQZ08_009387 [Neonectria magnoliae]|uniref:Uncharacterized protein n=1 Tax=Neonectria magnoliae TaxID=2732573 RepID=A0ABR1HPL4_9HYPO
MVNSLFNSEAACPNTNKLDDMEALGLSLRQHNQKQPCKTATNTPWPPHSDDTEKSVLKSSSNSPEADGLASGLLGRDMSDALSLHQSFVHPSLDTIPSDVKHLQRHGPEKYTLHLVIQMETKLGMTLEGNSLKERIRYLKEIRPPKDHETLLRPTPAREPYTSTDTCTVVCELQHYLLLQADYLNWPKEDFDVHARILACRGFGILRSETPPHMNLTDLLRTLAVNSDIYNDIPNDLATGLDQNALLDTALLVKYGSRCYVYCVLGCLGAMVEDRPILSFDEGALFDRLLGRRLKKYETLEAEFSSRSIPEGMSALGALALLKRFPEGPFDLVAWEGPAFGTSLAVFVAKCLATLGIVASLEAIRQDVIKVLMNINWKLEQKWLPPVRELLENCEEHLGGSNEAHDDDEADEFSTDVNPISTALDNFSKIFGKLKDESPQKPNIEDWLKAAQIDGRTDGTIQRSRLRRSKTI